MLDFVERAKRSKRDEREAELLEKEGVFTGSYCINPVTGEKMPIYVANFVVMAYGTGAVMAVPAHDQRDFEFAKKYGLPIKVVIKPTDAQDAPRAKTSTHAFEEDGVLADSGKFSAMDSDSARKAITEALAEKGLGELTIQYRLAIGAFPANATGAPIPIIYCPKCGVVPVPEQDLPVVLPLDVELLENGGSPLPFHKPFLLDCLPEMRGRCEA